MCLCQWSSGQACILDPEYKIVCMVYDSIRMFMYDSVASAFGVPVGVLDSCLTRQFLRYVREPLSSLVRGLCASACNIHESHREIQCARATELPWRLASKTVIEL